MADPEYVITPEFAREWNRIRRKVDGMSFAGIGGKNTRENIVVGPPTKGGSDALSRVERWGLFQLNANLTKGGMYSAYPAAPQSTALDSSASGSLTEATVLVADTSVTVYLLNVREFGSSSHALNTSNTPHTFFGFFYDYDTNGTPIYLVNECQ